MAALKGTLEGALTEYNESNPVMDLVLFDQVPFLPVQLTVLLTAVDRAELTVVDRAELTVVDRAELTVVDCRV